jgi:hypothetical protein
MRGQDTQQVGLFSALSPEARVPATLPKRPFRQSVDAALTASSAQMTTPYTRTGRLSIAPEKLLRAPGVAGALQRSNRTAVDRTIGR